MEQAEAERLANDIWHGVRADPEYITALKWAEDAIAMDNAPEADIWRRSARGLHQRLIRDALKGLSPDDAQDVLVFLASLVTRPPRKTPADRP